MSGALRIALGEYDTGWHDPVTSLARAAALIERAAVAGARLVALPEMCTTGFTMEAARYAEPVDGPSATAIAAAARRAGIHVIAGIATRGKPGDTFYNSAILFAPDGSRIAEYRKQRLFAYAAEDGTYTPGLTPALGEVDGVRLALLICFDLRFPELFRNIAPVADCIVVIANWPASRQLHWETLLRARSIECQAYVVGVNRIGRGGGLDYAGGSRAYDPWGEELAANTDPRIVTVDGAAVAEARRKFPFVLDARDPDGQSKRPRPG